MTLESAVLIGVVALHFSEPDAQKIFLILWDLALIRLLIPLSVPSPTSIYTLFAQPTAALPVQTILSSASVQMTPAALPAVSTAVVFRHF